MIIKIDHLAVASDDSGFGKTIEFFKKLGYRLNFLEKNIKNLNIKRRLMKNFCPRHDLAMLTSDGNIDVEVIRHDSANKRISNIAPIFNNLPKNMKHLYGPICPRNDKKGFNFNNLLIKTQNIAKSIKFWNVFGFKIVKKNKDSAVLEFNSPFKNASCGINLKRIEKINKKTFLDDSGFNCLAFVSNSISKEKEMIEAANIGTTDIESLEVNKKKLDIFFAWGNQGEIAEIISFNRNLT